MSDKMRWRYGETNPVITPVCNELIEIGDLLYWSGGKSQPVGRYVPGNGENDVPKTLAKMFIGIAMQRSPEGDLSQIRIATTGVFELDCTSGTFELGKTVSVLNASGANTYENQKIAATSVALEAIGRIVRGEPNPSSSVLVAIISSHIWGGVQVRS